MALPKFLSPLACPLTARRSKPAPPWRFESSLHSLRDAQRRSKRYVDRTKRLVPGDGSLVKVTSDKRFIDDASADTQTALSEKRKERDELRQALVRDHEKALLEGTMFYGGQEVEINGVSDFKEPVTEALTSLIPNIYPLFTIADRTFDFAKQLRALLNPSTAVIHSVAPELELFDTQGSLQRESALVAQVLEVIDDLEDEGIDPLGAELLDARDRRGFKGFSRPPFGWPDELLRLVLAACFRAGAIFLERQSGTGPVPTYDYKASDEYFSKI